MKTILASSIALSLALLGCKGMIKTNGSTSSLSPLSSSSSSSSARDEPASASSSDNPFLESDQLDQLLGKTPDEARKLLKGFGHHADVIVKIDSTFHEACGDDRVCQVTNEFPGTPTKHENVVLYVNPKLEIGGPPPE